MKRVGDLFPKVVSFDNLYRAFRAAARGKRDRPELIRYRYHLEPNLFALRDRLLGRGYVFGPYRTFRVLDPKPRRIVTAPFEDRIVHHAMCNVLLPVFQPTFIFDSYACLKGKGTHAAVLRLERFMRQACAARPAEAYMLQCDVRKYFSTIDHRTLKDIVRRKVKDTRLLELVDRVIDSAPPEPGFGPGKGLPIGNLTSQLFANVYLDPLDHFVKEEMGRRHYVRYVDDLVVVGGSKAELDEVRAAIASFLADRLLLSLHRDKSHVLPCRAGVTFLGYRIWPRCIRVKTATMVRMRRTEKRVRRAYREKRITEEQYRQVVSSLLGHVKWGDRSGALREQLLS